MRNPLHKRLWRELRGDWKKYLALLLMLTATIGFVSGMFVANDSMLAALEDSFQQYSVEYGHFTLEHAPTEALLSAMEDTEITLYPQPYKDFDEDVSGDGAADALVRVFAVRTDVNGICVLEGRLPDGDGEIAVDRMHADNQGIRVGDTLYLDGAAMTVTGLISRLDYTTLYENPGDLMFNALTFDVAVVTPQVFDGLDAPETCQYAFLYRDPPEDEMAEKERSDALAERLAVLAATGGLYSDPDEAEAFAREAEAFLAQAGQPEDPAYLASMAERLQAYDDNRNELTEFVPRYANQAIWFAPDDMQSDKSMGLWILLILVLVLAFIFAITASNTIASEATVVGTLRASGFTRGELLLHYATMPILVTLASAVLGNVLGYTLFKNVVVAMYYNSYSLPTYVTRWNADALIETTVFPVLLMILVMLAVIYRRLRLPPLKFLRNDLSASRKRRAVRLPGWSFLRRFRVRILLRNLPSYLVLLAGFCFVMLLLAFSVGMPATLSRYEDTAGDIMLARYQYVLRSTETEDGSPVATETPGAEAFSLETLETVDGVHVGEEVSVYGYSPNSAYIALPDSLAERSIYLSSAYSDKFGLGAGDSVTLKEQFSRRTYTFSVAGIYDYDGGVAAFLPNEQFNRTFGRAAGSFTGYLSDRTVEDIDGSLIYTVVTQEDILKMVHQLQHSMGSYMTYFSVVCVLIAAIILYLLTKIIIEKDAVSISMLKVLGFEDREIRRLYIRLTFAAVAVSAVIGVFVGKALVIQLWRAIMTEMNGWFTFYISPVQMAQCVLMAVAAYAVVAFFDMQRIRRVPLTDALKTVE